MKYFVNRLKQFFSKIKDEDDIRIVVMTFAMAFNKIEAKEDLNSYNGFYVKPVIGLFSYFLKKCYIRGLMPKLPQPMTS